MKKLTKVFSFLVLFMLPFTAYSSSYDDDVDDMIGCALWLCLPGGFPSDPQQICSGAKSKMISRLKDFKAPLRWGDCRSRSTGRLEAQPYNYKHGYYFFENFGKKASAPYYTQRPSGRYESGSSNRNYTYSNGQIIERKKVGCGTTVWTLVGIYAQGWAISDLKGLEGYDNFVHLVWNKGKPIEEVNKPFTPRVLRTSYNHGQCR